MTYIDAMVAPVPTANKQAYLASVQKAAEIFKKLGALEYVEGWSDDVPEGKQTSFPMAVQCKDGESIVFGWIIWPSKDVRQAAMQKIRDDGMMADLNPPFDGQRLIMGGFTLLFKG